MFGIDSDALIKLTKSGAKEIVAATVETVVPSVVERKPLPRAGKESSPMLLKLSGTSGKDC